MHDANPALLVATIVLAVAVLGLLVWLGQRGRPRSGERERGPAARPAAPLTTTTATTATPAGLEGVRQALAAGRKIEAIKLYRELTGLGLKESKDAVEAMQAGAPVPFTPRPTVPPQGMDEVVRLARTGQLIMAIKLHRELTGMGLKDSKDEVERLRDGR
jgi:ribosomal protein L7/L12